jgi:hypothetical protein
MDQQEKQPPYWLSPLVEPTEHFSGGSKGMESGLRIMVIEKCLGLSDGSSEMKCTAATEFWTFRL